MSRFAFAEVPIYLLFFVQAASVPLRSFPILLCTDQVVVISANHEEDEKLLLDKKYFDEIVKQLRALIETLEIISDQKLFNQILGVSESLEENTRLGSLHSFEEAFGGK